MGWLRQVRKRFLCGTLVCWCTWYETLMMLRRLLNLAMYRWQLCLRGFGLSVRRLMGEAVGDVLFAGALQQVLGMVSRGLDVTGTLLPFLSLAKQKVVHVYRISRLKVQICSSNTCEWNHKSRKGFEALTLYTDSAHFILQISTLGGQG